MNFARAAEVRFPPLMSNVTHGPNRTLAKSYVAALQLPLSGH